MKILVVISATAAATAGVCSVVRVLATAGVCGVIVAVIATGVCGVIVAVAGAVMAAAAVCDYDDASAVMAATATAV